MLLPDHETDVDLLNYEAVATTVADLLKDSRELPLTIGIHGDWGAGKSSVLRMIEKAASADKDVACLWFNGWTFQGFDDAKTVLIESIIEELRRKKSGYGKVKDIAGSLIRRIDWLKAAKSGAGVAFTLATGLPSPHLLSSLTGLLNDAKDNIQNLTPDQFLETITKASEYIKGAEAIRVPEEIHAIRREFSELLDAASISQLIVLIDDLDRCLPETAISTLEAIRLFLFVPRTAFVIGADEAMIEYAVRQHFPDLPLSSGPTTYARNYLEKLIQVPFRISALGTEETRAYVTLLLVQDLVGEKHDGFQKLLGNAREALRTPWLGVNLGQTDIEAVEPGRRSELGAAYVLAQQIGPILSEGTKGNPRQIKRFLNALMLRQAIAQARGFSDAINQAALAKLMLAERFREGFYEQIASMAMGAPDGKVEALATFEARAVSRPVDAGDEAGSVSKKAKPKDTKSDCEEVVGKWSEEEWLMRWARIAPRLGDIDLRPYVFVARDRRFVTKTDGDSGVAGLVEKLTAVTKRLAIIPYENAIKDLSDQDAERVFNMLREQVVRTGNFASEPPGFISLCVTAKHHPRFQGEVVALLGTLEAKSLAPWVTRGWSDVLTEEAARRQLHSLLVAWATQDENKPLKTAAQGAAPAFKKGG